MGQHKLEQNLTQDNHEKAEAKPKHNCKPSAIAKYEDNTNTITITEQPMKSRSTYTTNLYKYKYKLILLLSYNHLPTHLSAGR